MPVKKGFTMSKLMIMSLGGSPEPLRKSIETHLPEIIVFLASHESILKAGEVLDGIPCKPACEYEITDNPNMILECYRKARNCVDRARQKGVLPQEITVDYTGGTKVMTAALILATIGEPFRFNYVGGDDRSKQGLGVVLDGREMMFAEMSPWLIFAEEERRQIITLFNRRRFSAVAQIIESCRKDVPPEIAGYFGFVLPMAEGFLFWEQFNHKVAHRRLKDGLEKLDSHLKSHPGSELEAFHAAVGKCADFLVAVIEQTEELKRLHPLLIDDLLNNAHRRILDKRYDDAAARIYRALELYGQIHFQEETGCSTSEVTPELVPEQIREEFKRKYTEPKKGRLKLPLTATYRFLQEAGHEAGERFFEQQWQSKIKNIQNSRNESILAHGIKPVSEKGIETIFGTVTEFVRFTNRFDFPTLP